MPDKLLGEIGTSGLQQYSGYVQEEYLRELIGERGRRVIRQMINDYLIGAILFTISMLIRQVQWSVVSASESKEDQEAAEFVDQCREDMSGAWEETLVDILTCLPWGWSYLETVYKVRTGDSDDPSKRSKYTDNKIGWRKWAIRGQETLDRWEFDDAGGIKGMWQAGATYSKPPVLIPIEKALHFKAGGAKGNPEGVSVFRAAYEPWYFRRNINRIEGIGIERDLAGLPVAHVPAEWTLAGSQYSAQYDAIKQIVVNIRRDEQAGVVLPQVFDPETKQPIIKLELLSTGGTRQINTNEVINRHDQRIAATVLADFVLLGQSATGSFALSKDKTQIFTTALKAWCDMIASVVNRHAIPRLLRLNGFKVTELPTLQAGKIDSADLGVLGKYLSDLAAAGLPLFPTADGKLESAAIELSGLPTPTPESFVEMAAEAKADKEAAMEAMKAQAEATPPNQPPSEEIEE